MENSFDEKEFAEAMRQYDLSHLERAKKAMFEKGNIDCNLYDNNKFWMAFYWLKALICLYLGRTWGSYTGNTITVISYDEYQCMESLSWMSVWVGQGILKGWQVCVGSDGT